MALPILAIAGKGAGAGAAGGASTAAAGSSVPASTGASSAATNFGAIGGAIDAGGTSIMGWIDRIGKRKQERKAQANLDRAFEENVRQFGLNFALNEFATRKGIDMQEAQMMFNQQSAKASQGMALGMQGLQKRGMSIDLKEKKRKQKIAIAFASGFAKADA